MDNIIEIKRIFVVRNDGLTRWENSSYVLEKGELGIAWFSFEQKNRPIVKIGNGKGLWNELPQNDYLLTEDQILTYNFGRHQIENGSINAGGKGMLFSEWVLDSFKSELQPNIEYPTLTNLVITGINTDTKNYEVGSIINEITWNAKTTPGNYEFGTIEDRNNKLPDLKTSCSVLFDGAALDVKQTIEELSKTIDPNFEITNEGKIICGTLTVSYSWSDSLNRPATNLGNEARQKIMNSERTLSSEIAVNGYREGCFFGGVIGDINEEKIRSLNKTGTKYTTAKSYKLAIKPNTEKVVIAYDARYAGPSSILNTTVNAEMLDNFDESTMDIHGANEFEAIAYKILTYTPAEPYKNSANITITLG